MAAMQIGNGSAGAGGLHGRPWSTPEDTERFLAGSRAEYAIPGAELHMRAFRSNSNVAMDLFVQTMQRRRIEELNAPSSGEAGKSDAYGRFRPPEPRWLDDALAELAEVDDEIAEDGLPQVSDTTKAAAETLVRALAWMTPLAPSIYPTQDAEIALHFESPGVGTVVILLSDGGRADCHAYVGGRSRRDHYQTSSGLLVAFVLDQLHRLTPTPAGAAVSGRSQESGRFLRAFQANLLSTW